MCYRIAVSLAEVALRDDVGTTDVIAVVAGKGTTALGLRYNRGHYS